MTYFRQIIRSLRCPFSTLPNFERSRDVFIFSENTEKFIGFTKFKGLVSWYVFIFSDIFISVEQKIFYERASFYSGEVLYNDD